jgi:hypothetical protein
MYIIESPFAETIRLNKKDILYFDLYDNCTKMKVVLKNHKVIFPEKIIKTEVIFEKGK